ncbi:hypothetical protein BJ878DRAFT_545921 [Calycina marina]|uniref:Uncharacterized protein n=1 Tax=Calycina marina TaxID=1763456 RepID=A0A9P7YX66_9HELO|nr:hypothetical protein BJ878DRAFT_545921 [Calycina marina]
MSSTPKTRIPKAVATYDPQIVDQETRSDIDRSLLHAGHITTIEKRLDHALEAAPENWNELVTKRAQELFRSGQVATLDQCINQVVKDIKADTLAAQQRNAKKNGSTNGVNGVNGFSKDAGRGEGGKSLAVPKSVIDEGLKVTMECLEQVVEEK